MKTTLKRIPAVLGTACAAFALSFSLAGCERKEKIVDIEAPGVDIEVNKTRRGVEVESGRDVDIKAPGVDIEIKGDKK